MQNAERSAIDGDRVVIMDVRLNESHVLALIKSVQASGSTTQEILLKDNSLADDQIARLIEAV